MVASVNRISKPDGDLVEGLNKSIEETDKSCGLLRYAKLLPPGALRDFYSKEVEEEALRSPFHHYPGIL